MARRSTVARRIVTAVCALAIGALPLAAFAATSGSATQTPAQKPTEVATADTAEAGSAKANTAQANAEPLAQNEPIALPDGFEFSAESDCASCHQLEASSAEREGCLASAAGHAPLSCTDCHEVTDRMEKAHGRIKDGDLPASKLRRTAIDPELCQRCHSAETLAETTADSPALTDSEGLTVNPHDLPNVKSHAETTCSSCHKMHANEPVEDTASAYCLSCHHANVYECGTCH